MHWQLVASYSTVNSTDFLQCTRYVSNYWDSSYLSCFERTSAIMVVVKAFVSDPIQNFVCSEAFSSRSISAYPYPRDIITWPSRTNEIERPGILRHDTVSLINLSNACISDSRSPLTSTKYNITKEDWTIIFINLKKVPYISIMNICTHFMFITYEHFIGIFHRHLNWIQRYSICSKQLPLS